VRGCNVVIEKQLLMIVLLGEEVDHVGLELILDISVKPGRTSGFESLKK
jgi:hypothetical protein